MPRKGAGCVQRFGASVDGIHRLTLESPRSGLGMGSRRIPSDGPLDVQKSAGGRGKMLRLQDVLPGETVIDRPSRAVYNRHSKSWWAC